MNAAVKVWLGIMSVLMLATARAELVITDVNVVTMERAGMLAHQTVVVSGNKIAVLGPVDSVPVPAGARLVRGKGRFLMPGLTDTHVHVDPDGGRELLFYLVNGVTTVVSLRGDERFLRLREGLGSDDAPGPRLFTCGPFAQDIFDVERGVAAVRAIAEAGYDCVKFYGDWDAEAFAAATKEAGDLGLLSLGHAPRNHDFDLIETSSLDGLAHLEEVVYAEPALNAWLDTYRGRSDEPAEYSDPARALGKPIADIAHRVAASGVWVIPTNIVMDSYLRRHTDAFDNFARRSYLKYLDAETRSEWQNNRGSGRAARFHQQLRLQQLMLRIFHEAGVRMALGTDSSQAARLSVMPGWAAHEELELAVDAGIPVYAALEMGTINAASLLGRDNEGVIRVGARADLLLLNSNPLADIANTRDIAGVVRGGHWWSRKRLNQKLAALADSDAAAPAP